MGGVLDQGEQRPGQLGDTGIIVLQECSPMLKGCDCNALAEKAKKAKTTTTTAKPANNKYGSSRSRGSSNARRPRKQETKAAEEPQVTLSSVRSYRGRGSRTYSPSISSFRRSNFRRYQPTVELTEDTEPMISPEKTEAEKTTESSRLVSARRNLFPRRLRLRKRL